MRDDLPPDAEHDELSSFSRWRHAAPSCPAPDLVAAVRDGVLLPALVAAGVRAHLERCVTCRELAAFDRDPELGNPTPEELARIETRITKGRAPLPRSWLPYAAAAVIVLAAATAYLMRSTEQPAPAPATATAAPPAAAAPQYVLALRKPELELPPELLTVRSAAPDSYAAAIEHGLEPFLRDDYAAAVASLDALARRYAGRPHPAYYLGLAHLLNGEPAAAVPPLQRARELSAGTSLYTEATWYLAVALERSGNRAAAIDPLAQLCGKGGPRDAQACEGIHGLSNR